MRRIRAQRSDANRDRVDEVIVRPRLPVPEALFGVGLAREEALEAVRPEGAQGDAEEAEEPGELESGAFHGVSIAHAPVWPPSGRRGTTGRMTLHIGMLLFPRLTQLDLTGPFEVLHRLPDARVHLLWKDEEPVRAESGLAIVPTGTLAGCPPLDVLFVPGGRGQIELTNDDEVLSFLSAQGRAARYVTSVCTGSLLLGAAGLLDGYEATTHWAYLDFLPAFGARPVRRRVVVDRNRITAGGVTAGIDFGLRLVADLAGEALAQAIQLRLEYDPHPPFAGGHPDSADPALVGTVRDSFAASLAAEREQIERWSARRGAGLTSPPHPPHT